MADRASTKWLMRFDGSRIRSPQRASYHPAASYLSWHENEVFKRPFRELKESS
jgi:hypothetical protein